MAYLIGTAGHVDHGKTTLIAALTGIFADRLPEEKARGMTIDLGYAFIELEGIGKVSIVDVPGHERFIKNMLAGASGVEVALLCVAADEGVMPQTREHFQILRLLEARKLVVALTKVDGIDPESIDLAEMDVSQMLEGTEFADSPIVRVSAFTGEGLDALKGTLREAILALGPRTLSKDWFIPIDRAFTVEGHGTVVTGTMASGVVTEFDEAELMPGNHRARIRGVESHGERSKTAEAGMRTALNVTGVRRDVIHRGQAIGSPGSLFDTNCLNVRLAPVGEIRHAERVRVHIGTGEYIGRVFLFDHAPGFAQLRLEESAACARGQRAVIRKYSPPEILAGAEIVTPNAKVRRKNDPDIATILSGEQVDDKASRVANVLSKHPLGISTEALCEALGESAQSLGDTLEQMKNSGAAVGFAGRWIDPAGLDSIETNVIEAIAEMHRKYPQSATVRKSEVLATSRIGWESKPFDRLLGRMAEKSSVLLRGNEIALPQHKIQLNEKQSALLSRVIQAMVEAGAAAPSLQDLAAKVGAPVQAIEEMLRLGIETGQLIRIDETLHYPPAVLDSLRELLRGFGKPFTVAEFRDATHTSRKYALPLLQYFDETRFTRRIGDERIVLS